MLLEGRAQTILLTPCVMFGKAVCRRWVVQQVSSSVNALPLTVGMFRFSPLIWRQAACPLQKEQRTWHGVL